MNHYSKKRLDDRAIDELVGLSKGIIADRNVNHEEAIVLRNWMEVNVPCSQDKMVNRIYRRIHEMLIDDEFDQEEQRELLELLQGFTGQVNTLDATANLTAALPVTDPAPRVIFKDKLFCFTGTFAYGPRKVCKEVIHEREGRAINNITIQLDYLVCGYFGSTEWIHSPYGRKIEKAMEYRDRYGGPHIITEDHWAEYAFRGE